MFRTLFFFVLLNVFSIHKIASKYTLPPNLPPNANDTEMRILKGYPCSTQDHPFMVLINGESEEGMWMRICGGSLLRPDWVLSAAHCFPTDEIGTYAVMGAANRPDNRRAMVLVDKVSAHPSFNNKDYTNDIALIHLSEKLTKYVGLVKLPKSERTGSDAVAPPCKEALIMGWGKVDVGVPDIDELQCANVPMIPISECQHMYITYHEFDEMSADFLCTLSTEGVDACQGDSGGPLMCDDVQVGIISWGIQCGKPTNPGVYTRTDKYLEFIASHLKDDDGGDEIKDDDGGGEQAKSIMVSLNNANSIIINRLVLVLICIIIISPIL